MAQIYVRLAQTPADYQAAHALVEANYQALDYIRGPLPSLNTPGLVLLCYREGQLLGTGTLLLPTPQAATETEREFGYCLATRLPAWFDQSRVLELKRFAKAPAASGADAVLLALMLGTIRYALRHGYDAWVATLKPELVHTFQRLGFPLVETAAAPRLPDCLGLLNGSYYTRPGQVPRSVYCNLPAAADCLTRFDALVRRGRIVFDAALAEVGAETQPA